jgi:YidC/Oxa1 family membrane protein insertase
MDNVRLFLWVALFAMLWLAYTAWTADYAAVPSPPQSAPASPSQPVTNELPTVEHAGNGNAAPPAPPQSAEAPAPQQLIHVRTDVLDVEIDLHGGDLVRADLREYPVAKHDPDTVVRLLDFAPDTRWVFQTGLRSVAGGAEPNHQATFRTASSDYVMADGADELTVKLEWAGNGEVAASKIYTFRRGQYAIDLALDATAPAGTTWGAAPYAQMVREHHPIKRSYRSVDSYSFMGPVFYDGDQYHKLKFDNLLKEPSVQTVKGGWFAAIQHHFLAAAVPPAGDEVKYRAVAQGQEFVVNAVGQVKEVTASAPLDYHYTLFVGPKLQAQLKEAGPELELTVDYGVLTVLSKPLFWVLSHIEAWVNNWGWAIVICTFLIKLAFYKLTATSGRSMAKMRRLAPRMKALQERYKDDRQALSQATLELYKREKVNPAAGCLPIVIQMPFFFAFYWVLIESVEMRQAPFMLWIDDLSSLDPYYVLPLLMGVAMFFQTRMNPPPPDPVQARVMQIVPLVFTAFFAFFPSGLVLYWLTNTTLSIVQQWRINKIVEREQAA